MDLPTQSHLKTLRDLLTYRLAELRADVHAAELARQATSLAASADVVDRKEEAAARASAAVDAAQEQRDRDELDGAVEALRRLDAGTYGDCASCGEPISLQRLLVQPAASRCAACQTLHEHGVDAAQAS
jgi:DnaK suppressor protein